MNLNIRVPSETGGDAAYAAMKSSPPVAVSVAAVAGIPLEQWVVILTIAYLVINIAVAAPKLIELVARLIRWLRGAHVDG